MADRHFNGEPQRIFLGVIATEPNEAIALDLPASADAAEIAAAIERINLQRLQTAAKESETLREIFLNRNDGQQEAPPP